jgi:uncharacterized lipoprotein YajG
MCGKALFKSAYERGCMIEVQCAKCGSNLNVEVDNFTLSVKEASLEYKVSESK